MILPSEYIFNKNYKTSTLKKVRDSILEKIQELEKNISWNDKGVDGTGSYLEPELDSDIGDMIDALSEELDKYEEEINYRETPSDYKLPDLTGWMSDFNKVLDSANEIIEKRG
jgi:hypothetical protein